MERAFQAACLGITGYRAVFADGPVAGLQVLVHGAVGGVGAIATQMTSRGGATVIAVVRDGQQLERIAQAQGMVEAGVAGRVLLQIG